MLCVVCGFFGFLLRYIHGEQSYNEFGGVDDTTVKHLPSVTRWWWILGQRQGIRAWKARTGTARGVCSETCVLDEGPGAELRECCQGCPTPRCWGGAMALGLAAAIACSC